jgi:hypothetical protein
MSDRKPRTGTKMHTIRAADGGTVTLKISRKLAMSAFCTECLGFETNPTECTSKMCPMYPFRAKTERTLKGDPGTRPGEQDPF